MFKLKPLSKNAIPGALERARCYRFLNEPVESESICLDILAVEPDNQQARINLVLALSDQFKYRLNPAFTQAREIADRITDPYLKTYYNGIICERRGKSHLDQGSPGSGNLAYDWFHQAMDLYQQAIDLRPAGNDNAILRWNTCARILMRHPELVPAQETAGEQMLE